MTILAKSFGEGKPDKLILPIYESETSPSTPIPSVNGDSENGDGALIIPRRGHVSSGRKILFFLITIIVMCIVILCGVSVYRFYEAASLENLRFSGFQDIPYDGQLTINPNTLDTYRNSRPSFDIDDQSDFLSSLTKMMENQLRDDFFREYFDLDLTEKESYAKITVADFKGGRQSRFLHVFDTNQSVIIDLDEGRCFIMPLDREHILLPRSLWDLIMKMRSGYYKIDTERVQKNFRVVTPPLTDMTDVSPFIVQECSRKNIYKLEPFVSGVFKRDATLPESIKFAEFAGKHIVEINLINIKEVEEMENKQ